MPSPTADRPWFKYENAFFEAYSDAPERRVLQLLEELENFRAAVEQVVAAGIPANAPKTRVLMFRSDRDFRNVVGRANTLGFVIVLGDTPYIVMETGRTSDRDRNKRTIRHEFAHVLHAYSDIRLPLWYREGFAEYLAAISFVENGTQFTLGTPIEREWYPAPRIPWRELMTDNFEFRSLDHGGKVWNGYRQAWLLVHYLLHSDDSSNYSKLTEYINRYGAGEASEDVVKDVFGMTPDDLGEHVMNTYRSSNMYVLNFEPEVRDLNFIRSEADSAKIDILIKHLADQYSAALN